MDLSAPPYKASVKRVALIALLGCLATFKPAAAAPLKPDDVIAADFAEIDPSAGLVRVQAARREGAALTRGRALAMRLSNASFKGAYALVGIGQGGITAIASVGVLHCDGRGNVFGVNTVNLPGETVQTRRLAEVSFQGTYSVQENGMGALTTDQGVFDSVITKTNELAQEIALIQRELEPTTGNLLTLIGARLPDEGAFTKISLTMPPSFDSA